MAPGLLNVRSGWQEGEQVVVAGYQAGSPRVLVVEDDAGTARGLSRLLTARGYRVDVAPCAVEAIGHVTRRDYHLVLADCDLGDEDGVDLLRRIRDVRPELPVIVVTGRDRSAAVRYLADASLADFFEKPVPPSVLLSAVERHLRKEA